MSQKIVELAEGTPRYRVLPNEHFEFRGGSGAASTAAEGAQDPLQVRLAREARLLPEYAQTYPCLLPDVWELATVVTEKVAAWRLQQHKGLTWRCPTLDPQHFEFRDASRPARWPNRRASLGRSTDSA